MASLERALELLQHDFIDVSVEAKSSKQDGIAGQISTFFYSSQHKDVKAAAEAAHAALRRICKSSEPRLACQEASVCVVRVYTAGCSNASLKRPEKCSNS